VAPEAGKEIEAAAREAEVAAGAGAGSKSGSRRIIVSRVAMCAAPVHSHSTRVRRIPLTVGLDRPQSWKIGYPHPYFVNKFLVFLRLQVGLRRKILITKKFPAKSSRIRSYVTFRPLLAASVLKRGAKRTCRDDDLKEDF
jgi:hypothetical protein